MDEDFHARSCAGDDSDLHYGLLRALLCSYMSATLHEGCPKVRHSKRKYGEQSAVQSVRHFNIFIMIEPIFSF